jgi:hypothetical protein
MREKGRAEEEKITRPASRCSREREAAALIPGERRLLHAENVTIIPSDVVTGCPMATGEAESKRLRPGWLLIAGYHIRSDIKTRGEIAGGGMSGSLRQSGSWDAR